MELWNTRMTRLPSKFLLLIRIESSMFIEWSAVFWVVFHWSLLFTSREFSFQTKRQQTLTPDIVFTMCYMYLVLTLFICMSIFSNSFSLPFLPITFISLDQATCNTCSIKKRNTCISLTDTNTVEFNRWRGLKWNTTTLMNELWANLLLNDNINDIKYLESC